MLLLIIYVFAAVVTVVATLNVVFVVVVVNICGNVSLDVTTLHSLVHSV